jgi:Putative prokaryotic signal transducing protein
MISIYQAANLADAYLIRQLLEQERIEAYIAGEYLQGALGELPANTPVDVRVAPEYAARARRIVEDWERSPIDPAMFAHEDDAEDAPSLVPSPPKNAHFRASSAIAWLLGGAAIGAGIMWAAQHGPRNEAGIDYDGDGVFEERATYAGEWLERVEVDRNRDRKPDVILHYDHQGIVERHEADEDFNGLMEEQCEYTKGQPALLKVDRDFDGHPEFRSEYLLGVRFRDEWFDANGNVIKRVEYRGGDPVEGAFDSDGDGRLDTQRFYDVRGEIVREAPLNAQ